MNDQATRERILEVAGEKFQRHGLRRVTMDDIAREMRMSKKTLYKYFGGKEELVREHVERTLWARLDEVFHAMEDGESVRGCFGNVYRCILRMSSAVTRVFMVDLKAEYPQLWERIHIRRSQGLRRYAQLIARGVARGEVRSQIDPDIATEIIQCVINTYMVPETFERGVDPGDMARTWFTMLTSGLFIEPLDLAGIDSKD
ncbi:AcrR family transcriptional regulator [Desulfobaculum xiamenense]|uniref:AcrR family transcriptional regulator n=1 Tax=Desulfobaculum xiamenense TaxID=995050 RepID=A0A846QKZ3_9BACT|nr:TetR/AcrR family transcriptional regulator [Desulfobaculum xiamenense]NJB67720.1 AcrR family transcriptional regulator [Desulfobaculum xiamenense]